MRKFVVYLAHPVNAPTREGVEANLESALEWLQRLVDLTDWAISMPWYPYVKKLSKNGQYGTYRERGLQDDCMHVSRADGILCVGGHVSNGQLTTGMLREQNQALQSSVAVGDLMHVDSPSSCTLKTPTIITGLPPGGQHLPIVVTLGLEKFEVMAQRWRSRWFREGGPHLYYPLSVPKTSIKLRACGRDYIDLLIPMSWHATLAAKLSATDVEVAAEPVDRAPEGRRWLVTIECFQDHNVPVIITEGTPEKIPDVAGRLITGIHVELIDR